MSDTDGMDRVPRVSEWAFGRIVFVVLIVTAFVASSCAAPTKRKSISPTPTPSWRLAVGAGKGIEGYADRVSAQRGDTVGFYISTTASTFRAQAFRMGWYDGVGAQLVWESREMRGTRQAPATLVAPTETVVAQWKRSFRVTLDDRWKPGDYLIKLVASTGQSYIPLTVRDDARRSAILAINAVTTWQAYNRWGGHSLYVGPNGSALHRSLIVSFDRPYANTPYSVFSPGDGSGDFTADELGFVTFADRENLDITYTTDIDVHEHPELLLHHHVIVSMGHDEYWSVPMRRGLLAARDKGINIVFLGANAIFRRIRLERSPLGIDRQEVNYRDVALDPFRSIDPAQVTTNWDSAPVPQPPAALVGQSSAGYNLAASPDGVVVDSSSWIFAGTGLHNGDHIRHLISNEFDGVDAMWPTPPTIEVLFHSPLPPAPFNHSYTDVTYYTTPSGAGVFATGDIGWSCKLYDGGCIGPVPTSTPDLAVQQITRNVLQAFSAGPAGHAHPSIPNLRRLGIKQPPPAW
jgi:hypothetical protein